MQGGRKSGQRTEGCSDTARACLKEGLVPVPGEEPFLDLSLNFHAQLGSL